ncbi:MAG TPA: DUF2269 family protein [Candidatus Limnocylindrales bacterium]|jgi:uncharacterized membrane protein
MEAWVVFKYLHILAVITALGANLTYQFWLTRAQGSPGELVFVLESISRLDRRVANPAYIAAAVAGVAIVLTGPYGFDSPWIVAAIGLYVLVAVLGITVYAPAARSQVDLARRAPGSPAYAVAARRTRMLGLVVTAIVLVIVWLMVVKPALWG